MMKRMLTSVLSLAVVAATLNLPALGSTRPGYVDFGESLPAASEGEYVEVNLSRNLIAMVARLAQNEEPEVAKLLQGLEMVRVNVLGLEDDNRMAVKRRIDKIRAQLDEQGWERVVMVKEKNEDVGVYLKLRGEEAVEGLVVTVVDGDNEAVLVNIVGDIRPEQIAIVGERFNIEPLKKVGQAMNKS